VKEFKPVTSSTDEGYWNIVVRPQAGLFDIRLKDVWHYRDLLLLFVKRDISAQYKQTVLGPLWHFIQPLFTTVVFVMVFGKIANIPTDGIEPVVFYMAGISIWNYFSSCLNATSGTFVANAAIFGKVYFPRLVIPLSTVMSNIVKFAIQFMLLLIVIGYVGLKTGEMYVGVNWLLIPLLLLMMAGLGLGLGIIISSLTTKYRDFTVLIGFAVQLLMYATPVAYPLSYLKHKSFFNVIQYNPLTPIVEGFRFALFNKGSFDPVHLIYSGTVITMVLMAGLLIFSRVEKSFMDTV
jgi:lipopolysaccharide transport system permease protein